MSGRDGASGRYRGRHRKPSGFDRVRGGLRAGVMVAFAGIFVCWPQPSWADHAGVAVTHAARAHVTRAHVTRAHAARGRTPSVRARST